MAIKSYEMVAEQYLLSDPFVPYTSMLLGICACKLVYHVNHLLSAAYFKGYSGLSRMKRIEWNNRAMSTLHAIFITAMSLYLVFWSNLYSDYSDNQLKPFVTLQSSPLSTFVLGVIMLSLMMFRNLLQCLCLLYFAVLFVFGDCCVKAGPGIPRNLL